MDNLAVEHVLYIRTAAGTQLSKALLNTSPQHRRPCPFIFKYMSSHTNPHANPLHPHLLPQPRGPRPVGIQSSKVGGCQARMAAIAPRGYRYRYLTCSACGISHALILTTHSTETPARAVSSHQRAQLPRCRPLISHPSSSVSWVITWSLQSRPRGTLRPAISPSNKTSSGVGIQSI
jgi:hypothetical protein